MSVSVTLLDLEEVLETKNGDLTTTNLQQVFASVIRFLFSLIEDAGETTPDSFRCTIVFV